MQNAPSDIKHLAELVQGIQFAMMTTIHEEDGSLRSRPMTVQKTEFDGDFWFFTGRSTPLADDVSHNPKVNLAFSNVNSNCYVSVTGFAELVHDPQKAKELWTPAMKAWFPKGLEDPDLALLRVHVDCADYWDSTSAKMVQLYGFAKAMLTGRRPGSEVGSRKHLEM